MGAYDNQLKCTIGGGAGGGSAFQLEDYSVKNDLIVKENIGTTGAKITVTGTGWIEGTDATDYNTKLLAAGGSLFVAGQDFAIFELSGLRSVNLPAVTCLDGGPHISLEMLPQIGDSALHRSFRFTVSARTGTMILSGYKQTVEMGPDGLRTITRQSEGTQASAQTQFLNVILPAFKALYPPPDWSLSRVTYAFDQSNQNLTYTISVRELAGPLPSSDCVDGECRMQTQRDEQMRLRKNFSFDLVLGTSNYQTVLDLIRGQVEAIAPVMMESVEITFVKQVHLGASFEILQGADGNALLNWQQRFELADQADLWDQLTYPGADPILVAKPVSLPKLVQSGSATGAAAWITEAAPLYPNRLADQPRVVYGMNSNFEYVTEWTYSMIIDDDAFKIDAATLAELARPTNPVLIT